MSLCSGELKKGIAQKCVYVNTPFVIVQDEAQCSKGPELIVRSHSNVRPCYIQRQNNSVWAIGKDLKWISIASLDWSLGAQQLWSFEILLTLLTGVLYLLVNSTLLK